MVSNTSIAERGRCRQTCTGDTARVYIARKSLPHRHQRDSAQSRRATLAFEDHRARRTTAFSDPRTVAWIRTDAPVCHALVHLKSCGRRFDRHNALDWGKPTATPARSPVAADSETFEDSIGRRVFR